MESPGYSRARRHWTTQRAACPRPVQVLLPPLDRHADADGQRHRQNRGENRTQFFLYKGLRVQKGGLGPFGSRPPSQVEYCRQVLRFFFFPPAGAGRDQQAQSGQRHGQIPDADDGAGLVLDVLGHSPALFSAGQFLLRGKGDLLRGLGLTVLAGLIGPGVILKNITIEILKRR